MCRGLDKQGVYIQGKDEIYDYIKDVCQIGPLYSLLVKLIPIHQWQNYIHLENMHFEWQFQGQTISSSNPYVELFFRCARELMLMTNAVSHNRLQIQQDMIERLVRALNVAIQGSLSAVPYNFQDYVCVPGLVSPPHLRPFSSEILTRNNIEVVPSISTHLLQIIVYQILTESWMHTMEEDIEKLVLGKVLNPTYVLENVKSCHSAIEHVVTSAFMDKNNPIRSEQFREYVQFRYLDDTSDLNKYINAVRYISEQSIEAKEYVTENFDSYNSRFQEAFYYKGIRCPTKVQPVNHKKIYRELSVFGDKKDCCAASHMQSNVFIDPKDIEIREISDLTRQIDSTMLSICISDSENISPKQPLLVISSATKNRCCCILL